MRLFCLGEAFSWQFAFAYPTLHRSFFFSLTCTSFSISLAFLLCLLLLWWFLFIFARENYAWMVVAVYSCTVFFFSGFSFICLWVNLGFSAIVFLNGATWTLLYLLLNRSTNMQSLSLLPCIRNLGILCNFFSLATYKAYCSSIEILNAAVSFAFSFDFFVAFYHFSVACAIWFFAWFLALFFPTLWIFFFQFSLYVYWFTSVLGLFNELPAPP